LSLHINILLTSTQKAQKTLAASNAKRLQQTLYATLFIHGLFWLLRALVFRSSFTRRSIILYLVFSAPQLLIHWQFTRIGNPTYLPNGAVQRPGEDLEAKGLTEYMVRPHLVSTAYSRTPKP
jgi:hypothetical protein